MPIRHSGGTALISTLQLAAVSTAPLPAPKRAAGLAPPAWFGTLFLILIVLAPLPFGSNRPAFWSALGLGAALLAGLYLMLCGKGAVTPSFRFWRSGGILLPFAAVLLWAALQAAPLPSPGALANPLWQLAGDALGRKLDGTLSLDPHETLTGVLRLLTYGMIFWLALELGRDRAFAERTLRWTAYAGAGYAAYGLAMHALGIERILWIPKSAYLGFVTSTFVNRNSYATYAALGLLAAAALTLDALRSRNGRPRRGKAALIAFFERLSGRAKWPFLAALVIGAALLQTGSRAGALSAAAGLALFALAAAWARLIRFRIAFAGIAVLAAALGLMILFKGAAFVDRLQTDTLAEDRDARGALYDLTLHAIKDNPWTGTGLGTFPDVFSLYRDDTFDTLTPIGKAHNSYLGNALELGIPAALFLFASLAAAGETAVTGLRRRRRGRLFPAVATAAFVIVALHSMVDFSLEIPAVAVSFAALMGVTCAQSYRSLKRRKRKPKLKIVTA